MAEGVAKQLYGTQCEVLSAGISPSYVHPTAIKVMNEIGIDISNQRSNHVNDYLSYDIDIVITVCDHAKEECPIFPTSTMLHWPFKDPVQSRNMDTFRSVRDAILARFKTEFSSYINS